MRNRFFFAVFLIITVIFNISCVSDETPTQRIMKNKNVVSAKILKSELDVLSDKYEIEIITKDNYKIILHKVKWSLNNKGIRISQINDIHYCGGRSYEISKNSKTFFDPNDIEILGRMIGKNLKSVDDIVQNIKELYDLYIFFVQNSEREFIYKDKFLINSDFRVIDNNNSST
ncbi:MAG: hypothetical protein K6E22_09745 [Treponema sp.]|nr:hypothetical protein [Treponema sp.]